MGIIRYFHYMKKTLLLICIFFSCIHFTVAQKQKQIRVGLFVSLHLDVNFNQQGDFITPNIFPKKSITGLEFYEGCTLAIDSLNKSGVPVFLYVYDLQSKSRNIKTLISEHIFDSLQMVICQPSGSDFIQLVSICKENIYL